MTYKTHIWLFNFLVLLIGLVLLPIGFALGQSKIQVVTKTITKTIPYTAGKSIKIVGEKAEISVQSWYKNFVSLKLSLIAKHPNRKTAEEDLKFIDFKVADEKNEISITNFFTQKAGYKDINSNLSAKIELFVPAECNLSITNLYGSISLNTVNGKLYIDLSFTQLTMSTIKGLVNIKSHYGDIDAENVEAQLEVNSDMADISFKNLSGTSNFEGNYGQISIQPSNKISTLNINADRTNVDIITGSLNDFDFDIETRFGTIKAPKELKKSVDSNLTRSKFQQKNGNPLIRINGNYSIINLKNN
ncbi:MAG TPA: hypothetical protein DIW31_02120 [Bacteroidales bacterium]|nr:hypothetical protein [Bacteroidales bacterium]